MSNKLSLLVVNDIAQQTMAILQPLYLSGLIDGEDIIGEEIPKKAAEKVTGGLRVKVASDIEETMELLKNEKFDFAIVDMDLSEAYPLDKERGKKGGWVIFNWHIENKCKTRLILYTSRSEIKKDNFYAVVSSVEEMERKRQVNPKIVFVGQSKDKIRDLLFVLLNLEIISFQQEKFRDLSMNKIWGIKDFLRHLRGNRSDIVEKLKNQEIEFKSGGNYSLFDFFIPYTILLNRDKINLTKLKTKTERIFPKLTKQYILAVGFNSKKFSKKLNKSIREFTGSIYGNPEVIIGELGIEAKRFVKQYLKKFESFMPPPGLKGIQKQPLYDRWNEKVGTDIGEVDGEKELEYMVKEVAKVVAHDSRTVFQKVEKSGKVIAFIVDFDSGESLLDRMVAHQLNELYPLVPILVALKGSDHTLPLAIHQYMGLADRSEKIETIINILQQQLDVEACYTYKDMELYPWRCELWVIKKVKKECVSFTSTETQILSLILKYREKIARKNLAYLLDKDKSKKNVDVLFHKAQEKLRIVGKEIVEKDGKLQIVNFKM